MISPWIVIPTVVLILFLGCLYFDGEIKKGLDIPDRETYRIVNHMYICKEEWRGKSVIVFIWSKRYNCFKEVLEGDSFENIDKIIGRDI